MNDLTSAEKAQAAEQNWGLFVVYDLQKARWIKAVLPLKFHSHWSARDVLNHVIAQAQRRSELCLKVLKIVSQFNLNKKA